MEPKQKILIVDDSEINRAMLKEILGEGYEYLEAENGLRAIEILRRRTDIALVLLDLIMPEMDGFDVLRVMQCYAWQEEIPVIVISAAEDTRSVERAYDMGVADYIRRPFERVMVLRRVKNALMLYAKQKRLTRLVTDQVYEKEHNGVLMISILSHVVEFRNSESGQHVLHIRTLTDLLLRDKRERKTYVVTEPGKCVQEAILDYHVLGRSEAMTLVQIQLKTGRTHQIRAQFSSRNLPLVGDRKYSTLEDGCNIALWSYQLSFSHPDSGEPMMFTCPPPELFPWREFKAMER